MSTIRHIVTTVSLLVFIAVAGLWAVTSWKPIQVAASDGQADVAMVRASNGGLSVAWRSPMKEPVAWRWELGGQITIRGPVVAPPYT